jgi:hypothetical protein
LSLRSVWPFPSTGTNSYRSVLALSVPFSP